MGFDYLYGFNPVLAALTANKRKFYGLFLAEPLLEKQKILAKASELGISFTNTKVEKIEKLAFNKPHQGIVLKASKMDPIILKDYEIFKQNHPQKWLCLDHVIDPQNLGSILRSAHFFKVDGVVISLKHSAPLSPAVAKVSSGALEWLNIFSINDMPTFLNSIKAYGWKVIGSGVGKDIKEFEKYDKTMLVLGNEGSGLRDRVKAECDEFYWIPGGGDTIDSLNVGAAAGIFLHKLTQ